MDIREKVIEVLKEVMPTKELVNVEDIIEGGYIDSLELMALISTFCEIFDIDITFDDITAGNFNSVDAMVAMIERLK